MLLANQCPWQRPCFTVAPPLFTSHSTTTITNFIPLLTAHSRRNAPTTTLHLSVWKYRFKRCCIKARVDSKSEQSLLLQPVSVKIPVGDRHIVIETGRIGRQASGSVTVTDGETILYASVCMSNVPSEPSDFLPLTVNYQERFSAAGRTSGGFFKREGRAKEKEILICRLIDRPLRPTIMKGFLHDVQILSWVLSYDAIHSPDSLAIVAAGAALALSEVPIAKPVAGVRVGLVDDQFVVNPTVQQMELSKLDLIIAGTSDAILMIEGYSNFLSEESLLKAVQVGEVAVRNICKDLELLMRNYGKEKVMDTIRLPPAELYDHVDELAGKQILKALQIKNKIPRMRKISAIEDNILSVLTDTGLVQGDIGSQNDEVTDDIDDEDDEEIVDGLVDEGDVHIKPTPRKFFTQLFDPLDVKLVFKEVTSKIMRRFIVQNQRRSDGRNVEEVRQITSQCGLLPRAHGSALFTRGETQSLAVATLGGNNMAQRIDNLTEDETKQFYLQYSFPPSCVGEVGRIGAPSRREIGHGALAERALEPALPSNEEFPYTVRVESTITESNGSSSMASVCGGSLALLDAGVPLKCSIAGIAMGMIFDTRECGGDGSPMILSDILGSEDALGDMDLKVAGNKNCITAFQMDLKLTTGITSAVLKQAVLQARRGICHILGEMEKCFPPPSGKLSNHAPVIGTIKVVTSQISLIIGPSGRTLKGIIDETGVEAIDIRQEDGLTTIVSRDLESIEKAKSRINGLTMVPAVGDIYRDCEVKSLAPYGAFVEIAPGREGLLHVSELDTKYVSKAEDVVKVGDRVDVKLIEVTEKGHLRLSRRALLPPPETPPADRSVDGVTTTIPVKHSNNTNIEASAVKPQNKIKEVISAAKADGNNSNQIVNKQATAQNNIKEVVSAIRIDKNSKQIADKQATAQKNIKEVVSAIKIDKNSKQIVNKQATVRTKQLNTNVKQNSSGKEVPPAVKPEVE